MAKGKVFDEYIIIEFAMRLSEAERKKDKGKVVQWFMNMTGASKPTVYNIRNKILQGKSSFDIANAKQSRKSRKNDIEAAQQKKDILIISAVKTMQGPDKKPIPTARAIRMAELMGYIPENKYERSSADRLMAKYRVNAKHHRNRPFAHELTAEYPFHVVAVDATPIDNYYLTLDMKIKRYDLPQGDKHLDDVLAREQLMKIWVYYMVDMYSKAFLVMPFASRPKGKNSRKSGENADDYYDFIKFCMLPKFNLESPLLDRDAPFINCPVEGQITTLYCDKGSGIGRSKLILNMCNNLGIKVVTHTAGNPSAKGIVEGRISGFKRSYECLINPALIKDINQLIYFYQAWANRYNEESGAYARWREGVSGKPIIRLTEQNFRDATVTHIKRTINRYGCIQIDGRHFFVTEDEAYFGEKVQVYRSYAREGGLRYSVALDGKVIPCIEGKPNHSFDDIKSFKKSEGTKNRGEVAEIAKGIRQAQIFDDILPEQPSPEDKKLRFLPQWATSKEVHTPLIGDKFVSVQSAIDWILNQNGLFLEEIPPEYRDTIESNFKMLLRETGHIDGDIVLKMSNTLAKYKKEKMVCQK